MKLQTIAELGLKERAAQVLDALLDVFVNVKDFFVYKKVTLFEVFFFSMAITRALWFLINGIDNTFYDYLFPAVFWISLFLGLTAVHIAGFFDHLIICRKIAMYAHAAVWLFMGATTSIKKFHDPTAPTFFLYTIFCLIVIVRLSREQRGDD